MQNELSAQSNFDYAHPGLPTQKGFTLIELMIVVAIISVLASIALPSYLDYVRKARRVDAKSAILDLAAREERFYAINNKYSSSAADLGYNTLPNEVSSGSASYYLLSVKVPADGQSFTARATPTGGQTSDTACYGYAITQIGAKTNEDSSGSTLPNAVNCW